MLKGALKAGLMIAVLWFAQAQPSAKDSLPGPPSQPSQAPADQPSNSQPTKGELHSETFWEKTTTDPVAFFTFALFVATGALGAVALAQIYFLSRADKTARITAEAAIMNAKAAIGVELPILTATAPKLYDLREAPKPDARLVVGNRNDLPPTEYMAVMGVDVSNNGRTVAIPLESGVGHKVTTKLSGEPEYLKIMPPSPGQALNRETPFIQAINYPIILSDSDLILVKTVEASLFFFGFLTYQDFLGDKHTLRYCWRWCRSKGKWGFRSDEDIPEAYIKST